MCSLFSLSSFLFFFSTFYTRHTGEITIFVRTENNKKYQDDDSLTNSHALSVSMAADDSIDYVCLCFSVCHISSLTSRAEG